MTTLGEAKADAKSEKFNFILFADIQISSLMEIDHFAKQMKFFSENIVDSYSQSMNHKIRNDILSFASANIFSEICHNLLGTLWQINIFLSAARNGP